MKLNNRSRSRSSRLHRPHDGLQQVLVVARASLQRERFDFGDRNPGLAQNPLYTLEDGESIFIIADQGDAEVRILPLHVSLPSVRGGTAAARARAPSSVAARRPCGSGSH
jgi:hypothetical protein